VVQVPTAAQHAPVGQAPAAHVVLSPWYTLVPVQAVPVVKAHVPPAAQHAPVTAPTQYAGV
jgi:hypothetical protein